MPCDLRRCGVLAVVLLAASVLAPARVRAQPLAEQVPAGALVYIGWGGSENAGSAFEGSRLKSVLKSGDAEKLFSETLPALVRRIGQENPQAGQGVQLATAIAGKMWRHPSAFYFNGLDQANPRRPMAKMTLLCRAGAESEALIGEIQSVIKSAGKMPTPVKVASQGELVVVTIGPDQAGVAGQANLAADAQFKSATSKVHSDGVFAAYVNIEGLVKLINEMPFADNRRAQQRRQQWEKVRDALGLASAKVAVWTGAFDGRDWSARAFLAAPSPRKGVFTLLDGEPLTDELLERVPGSATMVGAGTCDPAKLIAGIRSTAGQIEPQSTKQIDKALEQFKGMTGLDLQADVLEPLGPQWVAYADPSIGGNYSLAMAFLNKPDDPAKVEKSFTQLGQSFSSIAGAMLARQNMQLPVRELKDGDVTIRYIAAPIIRPAWTIKDGILYAGLYPQIVSAAVATAPKAEGSILRNEQFAALRERLGKGQKVTSLRYLDLPRTASMMYPTWLVLGGYGGLGDLFGVSTPGMLIPPLNDLLEHLAPSGAVTWTDDDGWHMNSIKPFPGAEVIASDPTINIAAPALGMSILLPSLNRARETANRVKCASNMRQIGQGILIYSNDHRGKYPPDLGTLAKAVDLPPEVFTCPSSHNEVPSEIRAAGIDAQVQWVQENASYMYIGAGMNNTAGAEEVVLHEHDDNHGSDGMNLLFGDGHVEWQGLDSAQQMITRPRPQPTR